MRPGIVHLTDLDLGSCSIPVYVVPDLVEAKARDWHGFFSADRWEICISASCPPAIFLHVLAHEFKHAKQYLNGKWHQEDNKLEIECDKFAYDFVQLYGTLDATIEELFVGLGQDTSNPVE